jgi:hypothetical protein
MAYNLTVGKFNSHLFFLTKFISILYLFWFNCCNNSKKRYFNNNTLERKRHGPFEVAAPH